MGSINKIILMGNVGKDPEMRFTQSGKPVTSFSLATNRNFKKGEEWESETTWFKVTVWGDLAERVNQNIEKGQQVYVEGNIKMESWEGDGGTKSQLSVTANTVIATGKKEAKEVPEVVDDISPEDIPF